LTTKLHRHRCAGNPLAGESCEAKPAGAVVCFGYLDRTGKGTAETLSVVMDQEPVPIVLPSCWPHRRDVIRWASDLWGHIAPGAWVDGILGINLALSELREDGGYSRVTINPDPATAVRVEAV
jgi:hypothetical protein